MSRARQVHVAVCNPPLRMVAELFGDLGDPTRKRNRVGERLEDIASLKLLTDAGPTKQ